MTFDLCKKIKIIHSCIKSIVQKRLLVTGKKNNEFDTGIIIFTILQVPCPLLKNHTKHCEHFWFKSGPFKGPKKSL